MSKPREYPRCSASSCRRSSAGFSQAVSTCSHTIRVIRAATVFAWSVGVFDGRQVAAIDQLSLVATREDPALAAALDIESVKEMKHVILVIRDALRQRSLALGLDMPKSPEALTKALAGKIAGIS